MHNDCKLPCPVENLSLEESLISEFRRVMLFVLRPKSHSAFCCIIC